MQACRRGVSVDPMPTRDELRKYLETGMRLVEPSVKLGRERAEELLREVRRDGEVGRERAEEWREQLEEMLEEVLARSRKGSEVLQEMVRDEVHRQIEVFFKSRRDEALAYAKRGVSMLGELLASVAGQAGVGRASSDQASSDQAGSDQASSDEASLDEASLDQASSADPSSGGDPEGFGNQARAGGRSGGEVPPSATDASDKPAGRKRGTSSQG